MSSASGNVGVLVKSKKYRRTTIELDEGLYKRVKALAIEKDKTLREVISEALEEKLREEEAKKEAENSDFLGNPLAKRIIEEMERFISKEAAILLLRTKCEKRGVTPGDIRADIINDDFLESLCNSMKYISEIDEKECVRRLKALRGT